MANATQLYTYGIYTFTDTNGNPITTVGNISSKTTTSFEFSAALTDSAAANVTGDVTLGIRTPSGATERIYVPAGGIADGVTATGVTRGLKNSGTDVSAGLPTGDASFAIDDIPEGSIVEMVIIPQQLNMILQVLKGTIKTGGQTFQIGDGTAAATQGFEIDQGISSSVLKYGADASGNPLITLPSGSSFIPGAGAGSISGGDGIDFTASVITIDLTDVTVFVETTSTVFASAYLTGGSSAESTAATWAALTNTGYFKISIDGTEYDDVNPDFTGDLDMDDVAASIQAAIRTATGALETCVWDTDHFLISSVDLTRTSAITVTSTPSSGTDLSGAGAADWMDCDTGNGVVTDAVSADEGKVVVLDSVGLIKQANIEGWKDVTATASEINGALDGITATAADLNTVGAGGSVTTEHTHPRKFGAQSISVNGSATSPTAVNIAHGLGVAPNWVKITSMKSPSAGNDTSISTGESDGTNNDCVYQGTYNATNLTITNINNTNIIYNPFYNAAWKAISSAATLDATNIVLSLANTDAGSQTIYVKWEVGV